MVRLTRIYTKGGDAGQTSLGDGQRVAKHNRRVTAYGTVDEANAVIGLARQDCSPEVDDILGRIQNDLFDLGADLCTPEVENPKHPPLRVTAKQVAALEREIDRLNADLEPLNSFVLPGGRPTAAWLHLARTVVRRAERAMTQMAEDDRLSPEALRYVNRLSDLLFVLSRHVNGKGRDDLLWVPGANR